MRHHPGLQILAVENFAATNPVGFQIPPDLLVGIQFGTVRRQKEQPQFPSYSATHSWTTLALGTSKNRFLRHNSLANERYQCDV